MWARGTYLDALEAGTLWDMSDSLKSERLPEGDGSGIVCKHQIKVGSLHGTANTSQIQET